MNFLRPLVFVALCFYTGMAMLAPAAEGAASDAIPGFQAQQIKAAFLLHLFQFMGWPESKDPAIELCFLSEGDVSLAASEILQNRSSGVHIRQLSEEDSLSLCHVLYVGDDAAEVSSSRLLAATAESVLIVSDQLGFAQGGGMVELERRPSRIGLVINLPVLEAAGLKPSSKLLRLARVLGSNAGL